MASKYVTWMLPFMVLEWELLYAVILGYGGAYAFFKRISGFPQLLRDLGIAVLVVGSAIFGLKSGHSVLGLLGIGLGTILSLILHSNEFSQRNDMAPFGHLTAVSTINSLLVFGAILTSEMW